MQRKLKKILTIIISIAIAGTAVLPLNAQASLAGNDTVGSESQPVEEPEYNDIDVNQDEVVDPDSTNQTVKAEKAVRIVRPVSLIKKKRGIFLYWSRIPGAKRYVVFRKATRSKGWKRLYHKDKPNSLYWLDDKEKISGETYEYLIAGCTLEKRTEFTSETGLRKVEVPAGTEGKQIVWLPPVRVKKCVRISGGRWRVRWNPGEESTGYRLEYSKDKLFLKSRAVTINDPYEDVFTFKPKNKKARYYVRMMNWKRTEVNGVMKNAFSAPSYSSNVRKTSVSPIKYCKEKRTVRVRSWTGKYKKKKIRYTTKSGRRKTAVRKIKVYKWKKAARRVIVDYRSRSGQRIGRYDTIQGGCSGGKYEYQILHNKGNNKCRIIKISSKSGKIIKKSRPLRLHHGNDITYNSRKKILVAVHYTGSPKSLSVISPRTLRVLKNVRVRLNSSIYGASKKRLKKVKSYTGIAFDPRTGHYILGMEGSLSYLEISSGFVPLRFIQSNGEKDRINQGIECTGNYILRVQTKYGGYDSVEVRDMDGQYLTRINLTRRFEVENIYLTGTKLHGGIYANYGRTKRGYRFRVL